MLALIGSLVAALPGPVRLAIGSFLGVVIRFFGFRRNVVLQNLEICFPGESEEQIKNRIRAAYSHLGNLILEILMVFGGLGRFSKEKSKLLGLQNWKNARSKNKGVIHLASHVGNWEIMAATGAAHGRIDIMLVTKHLKPEWLHQKIEKGRSSAGVIATYEPKTFKDILRHLKRGGTVGIVLDQYTGPPVGIRVPFFGVSVGTHTLVAMLAKRTGAPVVPVTNRRLKDGSFEVEIFPELPWIEKADAAQEIEVNTEHYAQVVEKMVRTSPDQWLWTHRRFKGNLAPVTHEERQAARHHRQF